MKKSKRKKTVTVFWLVFATLMIIAMLGFVMMPLLYA
jgi:hypothetical protein